MQKYICVPCTYVYDPEYGDIIYNNLYHIFIIYPIHFKI